MDFALLVAVSGGSSSDPLVDWLTHAGPIGILALTVVAFLRGWIVSGTELKRTRDERDRALDLVYRNAGVAGRALDTQLTRLELEREILELREEASRDRERGHTEG